MATEKYKIAKAKFLADVAHAFKVCQQAKADAEEEYKELLTAAYAVKTEAITASEQKYKEIMKSAEAKKLQAGNTRAALREYSITKTSAYDVFCKETNDAVYLHYDEVKPYRDAEEAAEAANSVAWEAAHEVFYANPEDPDFIRGQAADQAEMNRMIESMETDLDLERELENLSHKL
jgi:hypothetical protein